MRYTVFPIVQCSSFISQTTKRRHRRQCLLPVLLDLIFVRGRFDADLVGFTILGQWQGVAHCGDMWFQFRTLCHYHGINISHLPAYPELAGVLYPSTRLSAQPTRQGVCPCQAQSTQDRIHNRVS